MVIPNIFNLFLNLDRVFTRHSHADGVLLKVPHSALSVYKLTKHLGLSFAYDAAKIWNDLPDDVYSATSCYLFRKKLKSCLFTKA